MSGKEEILITVEGPVNSGKSNVMFAIRKALKAEGLEVLFGGDDALFAPEQEQEYVEHFRRTHPEALEAISRKSKVIVTNKNTFRDTGFVRVGRTWTSMRK